MAKLLNEAHAVSGTLERMCRYDPDFTSGTTNVFVGRATISDLSQLNLDNLVSISASMANAADRQARRLTAFSGSDINISTIIIDATITNVIPRIQ